MDAVPVDALGVVDEHAKPFLACQLESQHLHTRYGGLDEARYVTLKLSFLLELSRCHCRTTPINKNGRRAQGESRQKNRTDDS